MLVLVKTHQYSHLVILIVFTLWKSQNKGQANCIYMDI